MEAFDDRFESSPDYAARTGHTDLDSRPWLDDDNASAIYDQTQGGRPLPDLASTAIKVLLMAAFAALVLSNV